MSRAQGFASSRREDSVAAESSLNPFRDPTRDNYPSFDDCFAALQDNSAVLRRLGETNITANSPALWRDKMARADEDSVTLMVPPSLPSSAGKEANDPYLAARLGFRTPLTIPQRVDNALGTDDNASDRFSFYQMQDGEHEADAESDASYKSATVSAVAGEFSTPIATNRRLPRALHEPSQYSAHAESPEPVRPRSASKPRLHAPPPPPPVERSQLTSVSATPYMTPIRNNYTEFCTPTPAREARVPVVSCEGEFRPPLYPAATSPHDDVHAKQRQNPRTDGSPHITNGNAPVRDAGAKGGAATRFGVPNFTASESASGGDSEANGMSTVGSIGRTQTSSTQSTHALSHSRDGGDSHANIDTQNITLRAPPLKDSTETPVVAQDRHVADDVTVTPSRVRVVSSSDYTARRMPTSVTLPTRTSTFPLGNTFDVWRSDLRFSQSSDLQLKRAERIAASIVPHCVSELTPFGEILAYQPGDFAYYRPQVYNAYRRLY